MSGLPTEAVPPASAAEAQTHTPKNPYNTRRKSLYFSPTTHSASFVETTGTPSTATVSTKHPPHHPEHNPRSPKRVRRHVPVDRGFTPPPSPPNNSSAMGTARSASTPAATNLPPSTVAQTPSTQHVFISLETATPQLGYDEEDDPVINAIVHVLQLSENCPLSTRDLSSSILEYRLCSLDSPNPSSVVSSRITSHLKRRAAEKPPREPLLARCESENGRKLTAYYLKYPERISERSWLYRDIKPVHSNGSHSHPSPAKVLQSVPASKLNILSSDVLDMLDEDDGYDSEDISNRSPDRPTLFDPPYGVAMSPAEYNILTGGMMDIDDVPTGIKLDYEFLDPATENLTPPSEEISLPNTPLQEAFSRRASPMPAAVEAEGGEPSGEVPSPAADEELPDDPQSPHSGGAPNVTNTLSTSFFDSPLIYHSMSLSQHTEPVELQEMVDAMGMEEDDDEVRVVDFGVLSASERRGFGGTTGGKAAGRANEELLWREKKDEGGHVSSPEKVGMDELEEWLEGI